MMLEYQYCIGMVFLYRCAALISAGINSIRLAPVISLPYFLIIDLSDHGAMRGGPLPPWRLAN